MFPIFAFIGGAVGGVIASGAAAATTSTITTAVLAGAAAGYMIGDAPKAAKERIEATTQAQKEMQEEQIAFQRELAGQHAALTEEQMQLQIGQRQIELLSDLFLEQDRKEPRIVTLPISRELPGIVDRFNLWFERALRT